MKKAFSIIDLNNPPKVEIPKSSIFSLYNNIIINNTKNIILDKVDITNNNFQIENDSYKYISSIDTKVFINIQLFYMWINSKLPYRFVISFYVKRNDEETLLFNKLIGVNDFLGNAGLYTEKFPIDLINNDCIIIKITNNTSYDLQISKNSSMQIEILK
jgi:hypothetical protein